jgi:hypothetical protein
LKQTPKNLKQDILDDTIFKMLAEKKPDAWHILKLSSFMISDFIPVEMYSNFLGLDFFELEKERPTKNYKNLLLMNIMNIKGAITTSIICGWPLLGFKRGMNSYDYSYNKDKKQNLEQKPYLFSNKVLWGVCSTISYINPFLFFIVLGKEIYRLEVNLRGFEDEKKTDFYNEVL